jgi:hypothetical protein
VAEHSDRMTWRFSGIPRWRTVTYTVTGHPFVRHPKYSSRFRPGRELHSGLPDWVGSTVYASRNPDRYWVKQSVNNCRIALGRVSIYPRAMKTVKEAYSILVRPWISDKFSSGHIGAAKRSLSAPTITTGDRRYFPLFTRPRIFHLFSARPLLSKHLISVFFSLLLISCFTCFLSSDNSPVARSIFRSIHPGNLALLLRRSPHTPIHAPFQPQHAIRDLRSVTAPSSFPLDAGVVSFIELSDRWDRPRTQGSPCRTATRSFPTSPPGFRLDLGRLHNMLLRSRPPLC